MSLLRPTPGAIIDRITILTLKINAYIKAGRNTDSLWREQVELANQLAKKAQARPAEIFSLARINTELWQAEDQVRSLPSSQVLDLAQLAKHIASLNDQRIKLIRELDNSYGCDEPTEEKIFSSGA